MSYITEFDPCSNFIAESLARHPRHPKLRLAFPKRCLLSQKSMLISILCHSKQNRRMAADSLHRFVPRKYTGGQDKQTMLPFQDVGMARRMEQEKRTSQQLAARQAAIRAADEARKEVKAKLKTVYEREKKRMQRWREKVAAAAFKAAKEKEREREREKASREVIDVDAVDEVSPAFLGCVFQAVEAKTVFILIRHLLRRRRQRNTPTSGREPRSNELRRSNVRARGPVQRCPDVEQIGNISSYGVASLLRRRPSRLGVPPKSSAVFISRTTAHSAVKAGSTNRHWRNGSRRTLTGIGAGQKRYLRAQTVAAGLLQSNVRRRS